MNHQLLNNPPQILRIKRKRTEDPLQALLLEDRRSHKRSKQPSPDPQYQQSRELNGKDSLNNQNNNNVIFKLARTDERNYYGTDSGTAALLKKHTTKSTSDFRKVFSIPKPQSVSEVDTNGSAPPSINSSSTAGEVNPELLDMLNEYLKFNDVPSTVKPPKRRMSSVSSTEKPTIAGASSIKNTESAIAEYSEDENEDDYVYDVYYRDKAIDAQWEKDKIGYIRFDEEEKNLLDDEAEDSEGMLNTDDEDSNDENFYRNEYPEDEDAGYDDPDALSLGDDEPSDDQDDEFDIIHDRNRFDQLDVIATEGLHDVNLYDRLSSGLQHQQEVTDGPYSGNDIDLDFDGDDELEADDQNDDDDDADEEFQRNQFFETDATDPMAIHRDRIFGKLEKMIKKKQ
ncbi:unnamed protein product [Ambrosiozyma monospora]|uniref:Unnamed protein product n=1 Tax=Ambrosiozyma monospora TaxID=43982 RepID=A0A9W6Z381_AMBMO|nr:unnamed protein product [Ambrosiozyma monospora]